MDTVKSLRKRVRELEKRLERMGRPPVKSLELKKLFDKKLPCKGRVILRAALAAGISYSTVMRARTRYGIDTSEKVWKYGK